MGPSPSDRIRARLTAPKPAWAAALAPAQQADHARALRAAVEEMTRAEQALAKDARLAAPAKAAEKKKALERILEAAETEIREVDARFAALAAGAHGAAAPHPPPPGKPAAPPAPPAGKSIEAPLRAAAMSSDLLVRASAALLKAITDGKRDATSALRAAPIPQLAALAHALDATLLKLVTHAREASAALHAAHDEAPRA